MLAGILQMLMSIMKSTSSQQGFDNVNCLSTKTSLLRAFLVTYQEGINGFKAGNYGGAIGAFKRSLTICKSAISDVTHDGGLFDSLQSNDTHNGHFIARAGGTENRERMPRTTLDSRSILSLPQQFVANQHQHYSRPSNISAIATGFELPTSVAGLDDETKFMHRTLFEVSSDFSRILDSREFLQDAQSYPFHVLIKATIFNLALSVHLSALEDTPSSYLRTSKLTKAKKLYQFVFQLAHSSENWMDAVMLLGTVNNLALVLELQGEHDHANQYQNYLLSTLMFLVESNQAVHIPEFEGFLSNVMKQFMVTSPSAPAA